MSYIILLRSVVYTSMPLGIVLNAFLFHVVWKKADKNSGVNLISQSISIGSIMYCISTMVFVPCYFSAPAMLVFIPASPLVHVYWLMQFFMYMWVFMVIVNLILVLISFIYRWALIARPRVGIFMDRYKIIPFLSSTYSLALFVNVVLLFNSPQQIRGEMKEMFASDLSDFDFSTDFFWGIGTDYFVVATLIVTVLGVMGMLFVAFIAAMVCGYRIHRTIKTRQFSTRTKIAHGKTLRLLIMQILTPVFLVFIPAMFNLSAALGRFSIGELPKILVFGFILFPLANPLVIIGFTDSYRRFVLRQATSSSVKPTASMLPSGLVTTNDGRSKRSTEASHVC